MNKFASDSLAKIKVIYSLPGWKQDYSTDIMPFKHPLSLPDDSDDIVRNKPNFKEFDFVEVNEDTKSIVIKKGNWTISKDIVFPKGYKIYASGGVQFDLINNACILSYSPLIFKGDENSKIKIFSSNNSGQGIAVLNTVEDSLLENVEFENLSNISKSGWILPSAITFYESDLTINNCSFIGNHSEDYLNIFRSNFSIKNSHFNNVFSDAFDADFATGSVDECSFIKCGNDAIDISGSTVSVSNTLIDGIGDKGLSAGEKSVLNAEKITIKNSEIAVASKDLSEINIDSIDISNCKVGYTVFQKKSEFGKAIIDVKKSKVTKTEREHLLEENSILVINGISINPDMANVQEILYGIEYGKSSKQN